MGLFRSPGEGNQVVVKIEAQRLSDSTGLSPPNSRNHEHIIDLKWRDATDGQTGQSSRQVIVDWVEGGGEARAQGAPDVRVLVVDARPKYLRTESAWGCRRV